MLGWFPVFLGRTSIKQQIKCLAHVQIYTVSLLAASLQLAALLSPVKRFPWATSCAPLSSTDAPFSSTIKDVIY